MAHLIIDFTRDLFVTSKEKAIVMKENTKGKLKEN